MSKEIKGDFNKGECIQVLHVYSENNQVYLKINMSTPLNANKLDKEIEWIPIKFDWKSINES